MARPINYQKHEENIKLLEKAAEKINTQGRKVSIASLAQEIGYSKQHINKTAYLKQRAIELIQKYAQPKLVDVSWTEGDWQKKYFQLKKSYQKKCDECANLKTRCQEITQQRNKLEQDLRQFRGNIYSLDIKNRT